MARGARDYQHAELAFMTQEQLVETCVRLESRRQMMNILLSELHNEKTKLQRHQSMLTDRIARVEGSAGEGNSCEATRVLLQRLQQRPQTVVPGVQAVQAVAAAGDAAAGAAVGSFCAGRQPPLLGCHDGDLAVERSAISKAKGWPQGGDGTPAVKSPATARSPVASRGSAAPPRAERSFVGTAVAGAVTSSSSGAHCIASALSERLAMEQQLSAPEELLLRQARGGSTACLTWFYNEQTIEQLANPLHALRRLSFEIRQQSEGAHGRVRARTHLCDCRGLADGEEVGEQSFEVEGCVPGRAYAFAVRAIAHFDGMASPVCSAFSETVTMGAFTQQQGPDCSASNWEGQSTTVSTPRTISYLGDTHSALASECVGRSAVPTAAEETVCFSQAREGKAQGPTESVPRDRLPYQAEDERRRHVEAEARRCAEEALRAEEEARRREDAARRRLEETRRRLEEEATKRRADEEVRRRVEEEHRANEEVRRREQEEAAQRHAEEEEARRRLEQEAQRAKEEARRRAEEEAAQHRAEEEAARKRLEQRRLEEEVRRRVEEERQRIEDQARRAAETIQMRAEAEAQMRAEEEYKAKQEAQRRLDEELAQRKAQEDAARQRLEQEAAQKRMEEEVMKRVQEERRRLAEERAAEDAKKQLEAEALQQRLQEEQRKHEEDEARRQALEEEKRRLVAETEERAEAERKTRLKEEALQQNLEEERRLRLEEEARRQAESEARQREAEELRKLAEEAQRAEAEAKRQLEEEEARRKKEEERRQRAEELARRQAELETLQREEEDRRREEELAQRRRDEEVRRVQEEDQRRLEADALQKKLEDERRQRAEEDERRRVSQEAARAEEAARQQQLEEEEELQRRIEEQIRVRVDQEAKKRAEEEASRRQEQEEEEARRQAEEEQAEAENRRLEEEVRRRTEEEIQRRTEEATRRAATELLRPPLGEEKQAWATDEVLKRMEEMEKRMKERQLSQSSASMSAPHQGSDSVGPQSPSASSFAQGFSRYCQGKAGGGESSGAGSRAAPPLSASLTTSREAAPLELQQQQHQKVATHGVDPYYGGRTPQTLPDSAARSPIGEQTPLDTDPYPGEVCPDSRPRMGEGDGAFGEDPMKKWMSKILAEKGLPPVALAPNPVEQLERAAAQRQLSRPQRVVEYSPPPPDLAQGMQEMMPRGLSRAGDQSGGYGGPVGPRRSRSPEVPEGRRLYPNPSQSGATSPQAAPPEAAPRRSAAPGSAPGGFDGSGMATVTKLPSRHVGVPADRTGLAAVGLAQPAHQQPRRTLDARSPEARMPRHGEPGAGASPEMTRACVEPQRGRGFSGAGSPLGCSSASQGLMPRAQTFGTQQQPQHRHAAASPGPTQGPTQGLGGTRGGHSSYSPAWGDGLGQPAQRSTSFSGYAGAAPKHGGPGGAMAYPAMGQMASQRAVSPLRQTAAVSSVAPLQAPVSMSPLQPPHMPQAPSLSQGGVTRTSLNAHQASAVLEMSQRMARATELQQRIGFSGGQQPAPQQQQRQAPLPINLNAPSLLNWAKEGYHGRQSMAMDNSMHEAMGFERQFSDAELSGLGLSTLHNLPPPPRSAPAAAEAVSLGLSGGGGRDSGGRQLTLTVLTSDSRWETFTFFAGDNLEQQGSAFLNEKGLKAAFQSGLVSKMRSMVSLGQAQSSVDIVDLI